MKSEIFKIGNYLHDREGRLCRVEGLSLEEISAPAIVGGITSLPHRPIHITKNRLVLLGFEHTYESVFRDTYDLHENGICFSFTFSKQEGRDHKFEMRGETFEMPKYIHQIQNIVQELGHKKLIFKS